MFALAILLQLVVLYAPSTPAGPAIPGLDKIVHAGVFFLPGVIGLLAGVRMRWLALVLALHAVLSELVQHAWLPLRAGDPWDVLADLAGLGLGLLVGALLRRRITRA